MIGGPWTFGRPCAERKSAWRQVVAVDPTREIRSPGWTGKGVACAGPPFRTERYRLPDRCARA